MAELTGAQKKYLRGLAHHQEPVVQLGKNGLTDAVLKSIDEALEVHELIKVRLAGSEGKKELSREIADRTDSAWVGLVGHVVTLYRRQPDPEKRTIELLTVPDPGDYPRSSFPTFRRIFLARLGVSVL